MIDYPKVTHRIPQPFIDKIAIDRRIAQIVRARVVRLDAFGRAQAEQAQLRYSCAGVCKRQRGSGPA